MQKWCALSLFDALSSFSSSTPSFDQSNTDAYQHRLRCSPFQHHLIALAVFLFTIHIHTLLECWCTTIKCVYKYLALLFVCKEKKNGKINGNLNTAERQYLKIEFRAKLKKTDAKDSSTWYGVMILTLTQQFNQKWTNKRPKWICSCNKSRHCLTFDDEKIARPKSTFKYEILF